MVRHTLEMTLMSFVCNFGGLLGMWLGFSVLSISKDIFKSLRRLTIFNQGNTFITNNVNFQLNVRNKSNAASNQNNLALIEIDL